MSNTDRNLLFGFLALQMDFIGRDQFVAGVGAWVLDKRRPLAEIFVEQGALDGARKALLDPLVDEHLRAHGNDVEKSLASFGPLGSVRDALGEFGDADVEATLAHVSTGARGGSDTPPDPDATLTVDTNDRSIEPGRRFYVLRPHARGGLGEVFVAYDNEVGREVALKEIQDRHADSTESQARFLFEAEVTGRLEHPGIVPIYGIGKHPDGRPFYAMRFIKGDSLKAAIARYHEAQLSDRERNLRLRELLGRFVDVCNVIEYAHSRGVLHRDIKPANIMLGKYGETLVVDWGLAKSLDGSADPEATAGLPVRPTPTGPVVETLAGQALGTPAYMSPEQAAGRIEKLTPASDVYSLGATLFALLTGKTPFAESDPGKVLQDVQRGALPAPRQVAEHVPRALEAICQKAMALSPADRYPTCRQLANDLEAWLADERVLCYREPMLMSAGRIVRRHPSMFAGIVTAGVLASISILFVQQQRLRALEAERQKEAVLTNVLRGISSDDRFDQLDVEARIKEAEARRDDTERLVGEGRESKEALRFAEANIEVAKAQLEIQRANHRIRRLETRLASGELIDRNSLWEAKLELLKGQLHEARARTDQNDARLADAQKLFNRGVLSKEGLGIADAQREQSKLKAKRLQAEIEHITRLIAEGGLVARQP